MPEVTWVARTHNPDRVRSSEKILPDLTCITAPAAGGNHPAGQFVDHWLNFRSCGMALFQSRGHRGWPRSEDMGVPTRAKLTVVG